MIVCGCVFFQVPDERFQSVCVELRQALSREQEAQMLIQEQSNQLHTLQRRVDAHATEQAETQRTLRQTTQVCHTQTFTLLFLNINSKCVTCGRWD